MRRVVLTFNIIILFFSFISFISCSNNKFHVEGKITNAKDSILYFEHNSLTGFKTIDSVKLDGKGEFSFSADTISNPEFYRLRISGQIINITIDSIETVHIVANFPTMAIKYSIKGSYENEKIKEIAIKQINLQKTCQNIFKINPVEADSIVNKLINKYKEDITINYIFKRPMAAYSYFALFQYIIINNQPRMIFNPSLDSNDNKAFAAVATSWDSFYPNSERTKNLHNITLAGIQNARIVKAKKIQVEISTNETGIIDLPLLDNTGRKRSLTEFKGKVILLSFHSFALKDSPKFIMQMRKLYNKYHSKGLEIFMVSLDNNEHFWKECVNSLPWTNVYDNINASKVYTNAATTMPIIYLIDRSNTIVKSPAQITNLEMDIKNLL